MKAFLTNGRVITVLGLSFVGLTIGFSIWIARFDLQILDRFGDPDQVRTVLAAMTDDQKSAHWWMTLLLDYLYPVAYGGFFAGVIWRFFGKFGGWLALLALAAGVADAIENTIDCTSTDSRCGSTTTCPSGMENTIQTMSRMQSRIYQSST